MKQLTEKEKKVYKLLSKGLLDKEIAKELDVTTDAVKKHCKSIYAKIEVRNRVEAAVKWNKTFEPPII
ncbi:MAG: response regulator transcription factor [Chitinophagaceae bacterium]